MNQRHDLETILFLHPSAERRSVDRTIVQLVAAVDRTRWHPVVVLPRRGPLIGPLEELGATIEVGPIGAVNAGFAPIRTIGFLAKLPLCLWFVWKMIRRHRPAVIHTHTTSVLGGALAAHLFGRRHLWHVHAVLDSSSAWDRLRAAAVQGLASGVVCSSEAARHALVARYEGLRSSVRVVRGAVDPTRVLSRDAADRSAYRAQLGLDEDALLVVMIASIAPGEGHKLLIDAARHVRRDHPDAHFLLVGGPAPGHRSMGQRIDREIQAAGLEGIVRRTALVSDLRPIYAAADIMCAPADRADPVHAVLLEAMATGTPVVATGSRSAEEFVASGTTGLLFETGDAQRLSWSLGALLGDPNRRLEMRAAALALHANEFALGRFRNEFDRAWSHLVERAFVLPTRRASVVHVVLGKANPERLNGVNHVVHHLAEAQIAAGMDTAVWGITKDPKAPTPVRLYELLLYPRARTRFTLARSLKTALATLDSTAIVHLHGAYLPELCSVARRLRRARIPYVVTPHGAHRTEARRRGRGRKWLWMTLFERRMLRGARAIQALSARELTETEAVLGDARVSVIPNGQGAVVRPAQPIEADDERRPIFAYCGRLSIRTKGLDALLEGFARYVAGRGTGSLWIIGDGRGRELLENLADELGVQRRTTFFGALFGDDKFARLDAADAFVHPSRHEGMPTAVLEAGALGLPLLVTPGTNLDDDVECAGAGLIIPEVSAEAVADALFTAEQEMPSGLLAQRGAAAAQMIEEQFSWNHIAQILARELYALTILSGDSGHHAPPGYGDPDGVAAPLPDASGQQSHTEPQEHQGYA